MDRREAALTLGELYRTIELPLVPVLAEMELRGVMLDVPYFAWLAKQMQIALKKDLARVKRLAGGPVNPRSSKQLSKVLYGEDELVPRRTKTGAPSTDKYALATLGTPLAKAVLSYRDTATSLSNYVLKLPRLVLDDGRVHGSFNQAGTWEEHGEDYRASPASGRLSSSGPNLQQVSVKTRWGVAIRRGFVAADGFSFVGGDIAQEELRIAAMLAKDEELLQAFERREDPHAMTAKALGLRREEAKNCNYALIYGVAAPKLLLMAPGLGSVKAAEEARIDFFRLYPSFPAWHKEIAAICAKQGYVETWYGRRRYFPEIWSHSLKRRREAERQAINHTVQGTGADVIKLALRRVYDKLAPGDGIILTSHDDVVAEAADMQTARQAISSMTKGLLPVDLPVEVKQGKNWGDMVYES